MSHNLYNPTSSVEIINSSINMYDDNNYPNNDYMQSITLDSERSSDSLTRILNELNIRYTDDNQSEMNIETEDVFIPQTSDGSVFNMSYPNLNNEHTENHLKSGGMIDIYLTLNVDNFILLLII